MDFEQLIEVTVDRAIEKALTPQRVEEIAFSKFDNKLISSETAAELLGVHENTIRNYIKFGILKPEPRLTERSPYKFRLSYVLKLKKEDLK
jgi:hypothetical protein